MGLSGKDTGVGNHSLLQEIFPTQGLNPGLPHCRQILYQLSNQGSPCLGQGCFLIHPADDLWFVIFWKNSQCYAFSLFSLRLSLLRTQPDNSYHLSCRIFHGFSCILDNFSTAFNLLILL